MPVSAPFNPSAANLSDVDQTTQGAGKVLTETTSAGKPFSWQTPSAGGLYSGIITKPTLSQFTWVNQGIVTGADSSVGIYVTSANNTSNNAIAMLTQTPPATPYTYTALVSSASRSGVGTGGIALYDGTKVEFLDIYYDQSALIMRCNVDQYTNVTTFSAGATSQQIIPTNLLWLRVTNDGANLKFLYGTDGVNFNQIYSEAVGSFITPTKVAFAVNAYNVSFLAFTLMSWLQT
jgi:hypothetical protein